MGKVDGFLLYPRKNAAWKDPMERIQNFDEFKLPLSPKAQREQAARCMNCGVPFCQSGMKLNGMFTGCPLHNLIPEWNDMLYLGNTRHALDRLLKTNCFPEFTGRVCPALCEAACTCGMNGESVSVHDNELAIIETAYESGWMQPRPPRVRSGRQVAIVGSGPSGLAAAWMLNHRGHTVTVYERSDRPGGLLMYGIPNMKLDKQIIARRIKLMEDEGIQFITGVEVGTDVDAASLQKDYDAVLLCCGAGQPRDLKLPGRDAKGIHFAVDFLTAATKQVLGTRKAIDAKGKKVVIVGGGDTGNDCVGTCIRMGCASVTQLEMMPKPSETRTEDNPWPEWPKVLKTDYGQQEAIAVFGHDPRLFETTVSEILKDDAGHIRGLKLVSLKGRDVVPGSEHEIDCDLLLIAAGFVGCQKTVPEAFGVNLGVRGTVDAGEDYKTNVPGVFAAGDMRRGQSLVVWGISEGRNAAREIDRFLMGYTEM